MDISKGIVGEMAIELLRELFEQAYYDDYADLYICLDNDEYNKMEKILELADEI